MNGSELSLTSRLEENDQTRLQIQNDEPIDPIKRKREVSIVPSFPFYLFLGSGLNELASLIKAHATKKLDFRQLI